MSDSLFAFLLALTGFWFVRALRSGSASHGWLAGALAAGAMAQRSSGVALVAAAVVALLCTGPRRHLRLLLHFLGGFLAMLLLVLTRNNLEYGRFTMVDGDGIHLFCRVAAVEKRLADTPEAHRIERLARENGVDVFAVSQAGWRLHRLLREKEGLSQRQADELLGCVARQALWLDPWRSVKLTVGSMVSALERRNPVNYVLNGCISPATFAANHRRAVEAWSASLDRFAVAEALLPAYPPRADEGDSRVRFVRAWARASRQWTGAWVLVGLLVVGVTGLVRRAAATIFFAGLPIAPLAASGIGEIPFPGHFDAVVPATWLALLRALPRAFPPRLTRS